MVHSFFGIEDESEDEDEDDRKRDDETCERTD